jgi:hypothetical protein
MYPAISRLRPVHSALIVLLALALAAQGCGGKLSAAHLSTKHWEEGAPQKIQAKFLRFAFTTSAKDGVSEVKGQAWPIRENLPVWVDSVDNLTIKAYLCDEKGHVLAVAQHAYPAQMIPEAGFPYSLTFKKTPEPSGGFFVGFGYNAMFLASKPPAAGGQGSGNISGQYVFYAYEQAVLAK